MITMWICACFVILIIRPVNFNLFNYYAIQQAGWIIVDVLKNKSLPISGNYNINFKWLSAKCPKQIIILNNKDLNVRKMHSRHWKYLLHHSEVLQLQYVFPWDFTESGRFEPCHRTKDEINSTHYCHINRINIQ